MNIPKQLTQLSAHSIMPAFSPDGQCVAFTSGRGKKGQKTEVCLIDPSGDNMRKLPSFGDEASSPIFNNKGSLIAYCSDLAGQRTTLEPIISIVDLAGRLIKQSTHTGVDYVFSPTGQSFVYSTGTEIYSEALRENKSVRLTHTYDFIQRPAGVVPRNRKPVIHPLENYIAFTSSRDRLGRAEIYIMKMDGTEQTRLTFTRNGAINPLFSPDGEEIYFLSPTYADPSLSNIFKVNCDGTEVIAIPNSQNVCQDVSLSPDGKWLLYTSYLSEERKVTSLGISMMNVHTNIVYKLVNDSYYNRYPCFSPDIKNVVYSSLRDGITELYKIDVQSITA